MCKDNDPKDGLFGGDNDQADRLTKKVGGNWDWFNAGGNGGQVDKRKR